ncbi:C45 family autoproteolytic acyltransferase/hydolase [Actinomadura gamaensis]|uniref:C45 family autoproteolytic acyltransferase/hydrolase n=1 Tax=Actinomadura gamaensis TaxID=1763541 RepID=A0ABV9TSI8_9ACTN
MSITVFASPPLTGAARGAHLGRSLGPEVRATWDAYARLFSDLGLADGLVRDVGARALDAVAAWAPGLAEEILGIAEGAALEPWQAAALNARSEVLGHVRQPLPGECSTAAYSPPDGTAPRTVQTWDWYESMDGVKLIWQYSPAPGRTVKTFTEYGILAKIGVSDAGLGVHFNLLQHERDGGTGGVPVHLVARRVLDEAATLDEAEEIARSATVTASVALTVVTRQGARCLELSPAGLAVVPARPDGLSLHTNHFLDATLARGERLGPTDPDTYARHAALTDRAEALKSQTATIRAVALLQHREQGAALCCHPVPDAPDEPRWQTLITITLDPARGALAFHDGTPCTVTPHSWTRV